MLFVPPRPLGVIERFYWLYDQHACTNFVLVAELDAGLGRAALEEAVAQSWARHPRLRCRIAVIGRRAVLEPETAPAPPVLVGEEPWQRRVEAELACPFAVGAAPLVRVAWCDGAAVFTFHHGLLDARSAAWWLGEVLALAAGGEPGAPFPEEPRPAEDLFPGYLRGLAGLGRLPAVIAAGGRAERAAGRAGALPGAPPRGTPRRPALAWVDLDPERSGALVRRVREAGATVQGALVAAQLAALRAEIPTDGPLGSCAISAVDLRPHLEPVLAPRTLGMFISVLAGWHAVSPEPDLPHLAREATTTVRAAIAGGRAHLFWRALPPAWCLPADARGAARLGWLARHSARASVVSNLGALPDLPPVAAEAVRALRFAMAPQEGGPLCSAAVTSQGALRLGLCFDAAHLDPAARERVARRLEAGLRV